jgi:hypothetical protein
MKIKKTGEDRYRALVQEEFIDEDVNDSQLLGMLKTKELIGNTAETILDLLNAQNIGSEVTVSYKRTLS